VLTPTQLPHHHRLHECRTTDGDDRDAAALPGDELDPAVREGTGLVDGWRAWTLDGNALPGRSPDLAGLLCDAELEALIVGVDATPLALGRSRRLFSPAQRRALAIRDGGCVMPGCTQPASATRAHHIQYYGRDNGPTDVDNGASLCDRDHGIPHRDGWEMFITDGWCWFRTPSGRTFWGQRHGHQRTGPTPDQDGYQPPSPLAARLFEGRDPPAPGDAPRDPSPPDGQPDATGPPTERSTIPARFVIPVARRRSTDDIARTAAALTELRIRLRREADAEPPT